MLDNNGKLQAFSESLQREHDINAILLFISRMKHEVLLADAMLDMAEMRLDQLAAITPANILKQSS